MLDNNDGTPEARFEGLMTELGKRFPHPHPFDSSVMLELYYIEEIDKVIRDAKELNAAKRTIVNVFTRGANRGANK
jgi:hypothetical protein